MGIDGISGPRAITGFTGVAVEKNTQSMDKDPSSQGNAYQRNSKKIILTEEHEKELCKILEDNPSFKESGLKAEIVKGDGIVTHIVIKDLSGNIVRHMPYDQMVSFYLERKTNSSKGLLLKQSA